MAESIDRQEETTRKTVFVSVHQGETCWYGVARSGDGVVATATGTTSEQALKRVCHSIPSGAPSQLLHETDAGGDAATDDKVAAMEEASRVVRMLEELERGDESNKHFVISPRYIGQPLRNVLYAAAGIPIGYVSTYGNIARVAGSEARAVGRIMATNPLYPIVPCHRVVGAGFQLVGYGGSQGSDALADKLKRITSEAKGYDAERQIEIVGMWLTVYPAEWVVAAAAIGDELGSGDVSQLSLFG